MTPLPFDDIARLLDALEAETPELTKRFPAEADFVAAFQRLVDDIEVAAGGRFTDYVQARIENALIANGWQDPATRQT